MLGTVRNCFLGELYSQFTRQMACKTQTMLPNGCVSV